MTDKFPSWRYGPKGESAVFESEADVPRGWFDHPSKHNTAQAKPAAAKPQAKGSAKPRVRGKNKAKAAPLDL